MTVDNMQTSELKVEEVAVGAPDLAAVAALLEQIHEETVQQGAYRKKQLRLTRLCTLLFALLLAAVLLTGAVVVPQVQSLVGQANNVLGQANQVMADLNTVSTELSDADISGMLRKVDELVNQSQAGMAKTLSEVEEALKVLTSVDIQSLNKAITDLGNIVGPLSKVFSGK